MSLNEDYIFNLEKDIKQLRAEREKLAKTADGVPVYVGMEVFVVTRKLDKWRIVIISDNVVELKSTTVGLTIARNLDEIWATVESFIIANARDAAKKGGA
jgi:hypothetical protein